MDSIRLSWIGVEWFSDPIRVIFTLLFLISLPWLFRSRRWLRRVRTYAIALLIVYLILISPPFVALATAGIVSPLSLIPGTRVMRSSFWDVGANIARLVQMLPHNFGESSDRP
jgi:hypothetical protein